MKCVIALLVLAISIVVGGILLAPDPVSAGGGCGIIKPIKPLNPIGCRDLTASCRCDGSGQNCRWEWICVPI